MNQVLERYNDLQEKINLLEADVIYTEKALSDKNIDYLTRREYKNDLIQDRKEIVEANRELGDIIITLYEMGLIGEIQRLNENSKKRK